MVCKKCGKEIDDNLNKCPFCGNNINSIEVEVISEEVQKQVPHKKPLNNREIGLLIASGFCLIVWLIPLIGYIVGGTTLASCLKAKKDGCNKVVCIICMIASILCIVASLINHILGIIYTKNNPQTNK